ncbi:RHS repeat-associated core domain-containing protein, partial [Pseudomonas sp. NPDC089406]|uniref:RHS repeat-associated core domain-containing protein n=1 Tax=Pseudomonas sp. NPDC089406 TaxID=3364463 RepID=UPI003850747A
RLEADHNTRTRHYTAHGAAPQQPGPDDNPFGFAGERREPLTGWYIPGGYRPYDPLLMIFLAPDSASPFGGGGLNPYAYCSGDPVNRVDPDGHSWFTWVGIGLGVLGTALTLGALAPAFAVVGAAAVAGTLTMSTLAAAAATIGTTAASIAATVTGAALSVVSLGTGVAGTTLEAMGKDQKTASILGWVSLGTGLAGSVLEIGAGLTSGAMKAGKVARGTSIQHSRWKTLSGANSSRSSSFSMVIEETFYDSKGEEVFGFFSQGLGTDMAIINTHGSKKGALLNTHGKRVTGAVLAQDDIAPRLNQLPNYTNDPDKPLLLLACHAGSSGAAQSVADTLRRPVYAYAYKVRGPVFKHTHIAKLMDDVHELVPISRLFPEAGSVIRPGDPILFMPSPI